MPTQRSAVEEVPAGREVITRVFHAPRALVFEAWTKVEHFGRWFGPFGAEIFDCEIDPWPGGVIRFGHRLADGMTVRVKGAFHEVVQDERLVFTLGFVDDHGRPTRHPMFTDWPLEAVLWSTVVLESLGDGTRVTVAQRVTPIDVALHPAVKRNQELSLEGWLQVLARLDDHLSTQRKTRGNPG